MWRRVVGKASPALPSYRSNVGSTSGRRAELKSQPQAHSHLWSATVNGEIIKSYCPWVWQETAHRKKYCKQMKNNVLVSTACPCACAGY